jgi:hypothetical protein
MNSKEFSLKIEEFVKQKKCSYLDAVVLYCDENEIDTATVNPLISKSLKEKIKIEAIEKRLLKESKSGKLPV